MLRLITFLFLMLPVFALAQGLPSIEEKTKSLKKSEGYLNFYWDETAGKLWLEIDKVGTEMLYYTSMPAAIGSNDIGLDRGRLADIRIIKFNRSGRKLLMVQPNYDFRAITTDPAEQKAVEQSFAQSTLWGFTIEAESGSRVLVDATDFLLRDATRVGNTLKSQQQGNFVFDKTRSVIHMPMTKNFPLNTELEASITLVNNDGTVGANLRSVAPSEEAVTFRIHHSFVQLPDNNYKPRKFDARSGFFNISYLDYSTPVAEPIVKYFIARHRLEKKDPAAARSEAVKPIIYYVDNGVPEPIRSALVEGAQWWNQAFEAAGYINAFQVKILPEDADPMDVRYNVINWVHRSTRGWSYGDSVADPRTGEIIKGHVSLGSQRVRQDYLIAQGLLGFTDDEDLKGVDSNDPRLVLALNRLKQLSAHEVGHTLGLMHNYAASVVNRSSVMDYPHPYIKLNAKNEFDFSDAYDLKIGDWDKISIAYGYSDFVDNATEEKELEKILGNAYSKGFKFISDRDAAAPGSFHPEAHHWDNGTNASGELERVMKLRARALAEFDEDNIRKGTPMAFLEDALVPIYLFHRYQLIAATKLVGGMHYTYALKGDGQVLMKPLTKAEQMKALQSVIAALDPAFLKLPDRIVKLIPPLPAGYNYTRELFLKRTGLAFDILSPAETAVDLPLSLLFNSQRMNRMVEFEVQHAGLGLDEMIRSLVAATWKAPRKKGVEALIQMQTEQLLLTYLLAASIDENNSFITRSVIQHSLSQLKTFIEEMKKSFSDPVYVGHLLLAQERMKDPTKAKPTVHAPMPPGAPIGCE